PLAAARARRRAARLPRLRDGDAPARQPARRGDGPHGRHPGPRGDHGAGDLQGLRAPVAERAVPITDEVLDRIPGHPGVYLFKDAAGEVIYVGKAVSLRARVRQYFRGGDERLFVAAGFLARAADDVETIVVPSEKEALLLENHLIKKHHPRFNVKLRDDKQYLVLRLVPPEPPGASPTPHDRPLF